ELVGHPALVVGTLAAAHAGPEPVLVREDVLVDDRRRPHADVVGALVERRHRLHVHGHSPFSLVARLCSEYRTRRPCGTRVESHTPPANTAPAVAQPFCNRTITPAPTCGRSVPALSRRPLARSV